MGRVGLLGLHLVLWDTSTVTMISKWISWLSLHLVLWDTSTVDWVCLLGLHLVLWHWTTVERVSRLSLHLVLWYWTTAMTKTRISSLLLSLSLGGTSMDRVCFLGLHLVLAQEATTEHWILPLHLGLHQVSVPVSTTVSCLVLHLALRSSGILLCLHLWLHQVSEATSKDFLVLHLALRSRVCLLCLHLGLSQGRRETTTIKSECLLVLSLHLAHQWWWVNLGPTHLPMRHFRSVTRFL
jgi:hypothetical protein